MTAYADELSIKKRVSEILLQGSSVRTVFNRKQQCLCSLLGQERTEDQTLLNCAQIPKLLLSRPWLHMSYNSIQTVCPGALCLGALVCLLKF